MKIFVKVFLVVVAMLVLTSAVFAAPRTQLKSDKDTVSVTITPTHYKHLLILKANKAYMGAAVEVQDGTGIVVASSRIYKKKMIIDFYDIPYGTYSICIITNTKTLEFNYTKKLDSKILN